MALLPLKGNDDCVIFLYALKSFNVRGLLKSILCYVVFLDNEMLSYYSLSLDSVFVVVVVNITLFVFWSDFQLLCRTWASQGPLRFHLDLRAP